MTKQVTDGYFVFQVDRDLAARGFGAIGEWAILDQGNEVPEELMGCGPWATREEAQRRLDDVTE